MDCPPLERLISWLDLDPDEGLHAQALEHLEVCPECARLVEAAGDVELVLGEPSLWAGPCLNAEELLAAVAEDLGERTAHLEACAACREELEAARAPEAAPAPARLRARLKSLATGASTTEARVRGLRPLRRGASARVRGSATGRLRSGSGRVGTGSRRSSARRSGAGSVRRPVSARRSLRAPAPRVHQPLWAWGALAAAAALLAALALALSSPPPSELADAVPRRASGELGEAGPRVSDVQARAPRSPRSSEGPVSREPEAVPLGDGPFVPAPDPLAPDLDEAAPPPGRPAAPPNPAPAGADESARPSPPSPGDETLARADATSAGSGATRPAGDAPSDRRGLLEGTVSDDGGRLALALQRLAGSLVLERGGERRRLQRAAGEVALRPGDLLSSARGAFVSLDGGAFDLCLDRGTRLQVRAARSGPFLGLEQGRVLAEVATLPSGRRFGVVTREAEFHVLGTVFAVEAGAGGSRVVVAEGTVEARAGGQTVRVPAGRACASDPRGRLARPRPASAEELAWAEALAPRRRLLFEATFDDRKLRGFVGALSEAEAAAPGDLCLRLQPLAGNRFWGQWAHAPQGRLPSLRAAPGVALQFSLWTERPAEVLLQARNETQGKDFKRSFAHPGGFWKTFTVALMDLSTYYDPGKHPVREGDLFTDLEVYACEPGDAQVVLLDDVRVYRKLYR